MDIKTIQNINDNITELNVKKGRILLALREKVITRKDVMISFLKVSLTSFIGYYFIINCAALLLDYTNKNESFDLIVSFVPLLYILAFWFATLPFASYSKEQIKITKDLFKKEQLEIIFQKLMNFLMIAVFLFFAFIFLSFLEDSQGNSLLFSHFKSFLSFSYNYGLPLSMGCFCVSFLYNFFTSPHFEHIHSKEQNLKKEDQKLEIEIKENYNLLKENVIDFCQTVNDIEYLKMHCFDNSSKHIENVLEEIQDIVAKNNGFQNFNDMKNQDVKIRYECKNYIIND